MIKIFRLTKGHSRLRSNFNARVVLHIVLLAISIGCLTGHPYLARLQLRTPASLIQAYSTRRLTICTDRPYKKSVKTLPQPLEIKFKKRRRTFFRQIKTTRRPLVTCSWTTKIIWYQACSNRTLACWCFRKVRARPTLLLSRKNLTIKTYRFIRAWAVSNSRPTPHEDYFSSQILTITMADKLAKDITTT